MTSPSPSSRPTLRSDLSSIECDGRQRPHRIIIDEIGGRFARVSERVWQKLVGGEAEEELWSEAFSAGWLRQRPSKSTRKFSPLAIRIPVGSIDELANSLAKHSGWIFSPKAVVCWLSLIALSAVLILSRSDQLFAALTLIPSFLQTTHPLTLMFVVIATKAIHELSHAVMCRRVGARCGRLGVMFLCGIPCPYCEVTDVWRQPSSLKRAAVMLSGIYVELIVAALAAMVWIGSAEQGTQLWALNVMLICGVSTLVFNANPFMRFDGYHVLADLLQSANLRHEASMAFRSVVTRRLAGPLYLSSRRSDRRAIALAGFHFASTLYRLFVSCVIAALLLQYATWFGLRNVAVILVVILAVAVLVRFIRRLGSVVTGSGPWQRVSLPRRLGPVGLFVVFTVFVAIIPLPRYRRAVGVVDAAATRVVFAPADGLVVDVTTEFGQVINDGDTLVRLDSREMQVHEAKLSGDLHLATMRNEHARRFALSGPSTTTAQSTDQWRTLQAAQDATAMQLASVRKRVSELQLRSAMQGVVLPASATVADEPQDNSLKLRRGQAVLAGQALCRIAQGGQLHAMLVLDARDRSSIEVGSTVMIALTNRPQRVYRSKVATVSAIAQVENDDLHTAAYQVLCPLPNVPDQQLLTWVGQECRGVFRLPRQTLASAMLTWVGNWLRG